MIIAVMTNRLTQLALSLGFEEDLFQTHTTFLTEQYLRDAARALFSLSLILSLFRARVLAKALFLCRLFTHPCSSSIVIIDDRSLKKKVHIQNVQFYASAVKNAAFICSLLRVCLCLCVSRCARRDSIRLFYYNNSSKSQKGHQGNEEFSFPN